MSTPLLSVLVTVFNREEYLPHTLRSILDSTFCDFEVIVVDDASADGSLSMARQFAEEDERIQVFQNEHNLGDYPNRMKAAALARGRYLKYVDSDDIIYPHSLAIMADSMERHPDTALGLSHSLPQDDRPYPQHLQPEETCRKHFLGRGCLSCGPSGAIIRAQSFEAIGGFRTGWGVLSDIDLWYRMAAKWPTLLLPPSLVWWRRHEAQEFRKEGAELYYLRRGYELKIDALSQMDCPLPTHERDFALGRSRQHFARHLWSLALRQHRMAAALRVFRESDLAVSDLVRGLRKYQ